MLYVTEIVSVIQHKRICICVYFCDIIPVKASPGTPAYKSQEEYYDQILEYKRVWIFIYNLCGIAGWSVYSVKSTLINEFCEKKT